MRIINYIEHIFTCYVSFYSSFRLGKLYRYTGSKYDTVSLNAFATKTYNDARAEPVPPPPSFQM